MFPYFLLTALAVTMAVYGGEPPFSPWIEPSVGRSLLLSLLAAAAYGAAGLLAAGWLLRDLAPGRRRGDPFLRLHRFARIYRAGVALLYAVQLYGFGWRDASASVPLPEWPGALSAVGLLLAPFLAAVAASWGAAFRVLRTLRPRQIPLRVFLSVQVRQYLTAAAGILLFLLFLDALALVPQAWIDAAERAAPRELVDWGIYASFLVAAYLLMPLLLRLLWRARPFPEGPLRDRLARLCEDVAFRPRRILLWETQGAVMNACTVGAVPQLRYILITDGLVENLEPDEVEAVFAHELGHVRARHFLLYILFSLSVWACLSVAQMWAARAAPQDGGGEGGFWPYFLQTAALLGLVWGVLFGLLSRRLERQADLLGAARIRDPGALQRALRKIALLGGQSGRLRTLTHGSIDGRIDHLSEALADPGALRRANRAVLWLGAFMALCLGLAVFLLAVQGTRST